MYRDEKVGIELYHQRFEEAKATLEEIAKKNESIYFNLNDTQLDFALTELGFRKEEVRRKPLKVVYIREKSAELEVLVDDNYLYLCQIPAGHDVKEWYASIPSLKEWNDRIDRIGGAFIGFGFIATALASMYTYFASGGPIAGLTAIVGFGISLIPALAVRIWYDGYMPLDKYTLVKGVETLRYIAKTSKYEAPQLRIENKSRIIDDEFADPTMQEQAVLETLAIEEQAQKEQKIK